MGRPPRQALPAVAAAGSNATISDRIASCMNPEFAQWLYELWQEAAQRDGNKLQYVYKRAMDCMIMHPEVIGEVWDAQKVAYVGPGIVARLERRLQKFLAEGGRMIRWDNLGAALPSSQPVVANVVQTPAFDALDAMSQPANPPVRQRQPPKARPYIPTYRSGPYAMLIALYVEAQRPDSKGYCTRQDIVALGQPYCSVPMEEGTFSALKGAIKKLEEKELVTKWAMPYRYALTDAGQEIAERLWNSGERRSSVPVPDNPQIPQKRQVPEPIILEEGCSRAEGDLMTFTWTPGTYDLVLLIDNREVKSRTERDYLFTSLSAAGIAIEQRSLELGDFLWIARRKQAFRIGSHDDLEEAVLDLLIERKTEDDLLHSIIDGRFIEQKYRINSSGITNRIYLLEKFEGVDLTALGEHKFRAAVTHTQVLDNLFLRYTTNLQESIKFILALHHDLVRKHSSRSLHLAIPTLDVSDLRRAPFLSALTRQSQLDAGRKYLMTYGSYAAINSKSGNLSRNELFMRQLMTIRQMSAERAEAIAQRFPTPFSLYEMYAGLPDEQNRKDYFKEWILPHQSKRFGPSLSQKIYEAFWAPPPT